MKKTRSTFELPSWVHHPDAPGDPLFTATIRQVRDRIMAWIEEGGLTRRSAVYTFNWYVVTDNTAVRIRQNLGELLDGLHRWIAKGHGDDLWQFDIDNWHDVVGLLAKCRHAGRWVLVIGFSDTYEDGEL